MNAQFAAILICSALPLAGALKQPVRTAGGMLSGSPGRDPAVTVFKGVPFAAPPVGELRWRAPQPAAAWNGVRAATEFGPNCMQEIVDRRDPWTYEFMAHGVTSEDCLYLNVWTAAWHADEKRPVFVFIHGGAFSEGSGSVPVYDGEGLAKRGLVVVTINYRLGVLGFLAHPELSKESGHNVSGNYGLLDQVAVLRWIHDNIAAFGGDPGRVTIAGQSAGGMSVLALAESEIAKGLFHRAIVESALGLTMPNQPLKDAEAEGVKFVEVKGAKSIVELREIPWAALAARGTGGGTFAFSPVIDGWVRPSGAAPVDVPFLTGTNADELGASPHPNAQLDGWKQRMARFGDLADAFSKLYPVASEADVAAAANGSARDSARAAVYVWALRRMESAKSKVFTYFFTHPLPGPDIGKYGAFHTAEVPYALNSLSRSERPFGTADRKLADVISSYWANFARTGDPNGKGLPLWPAVSAEQAVTMELGDIVRPIPVAEKEKLEFHRSYLTRSRR